MSTLIPQGEDLRRAVKWITDTLEAQSDQSRTKIIEEAVFQFDLSPLEAEFLINFFCKKSS